MARFCLNIVAVLLGALVATGDDDVCVAQDNDDECRRSATNALAADAVLETESQEMATSLLQTRQLKAAALDRSEAEAPRRGGTCEGWSPSYGPSAGMGGHCDFWGDDHRWCFVHANYTGAGSDSIRPSRFYTGHYFALCDISNRLSDARKLFNKFVLRHKILERLSHGEFKVYEQRFFTSAPVPRRNPWRSVTALMKLLWESLPVTTAMEVKAINNMNLGWTAEKPADDEDVLTVSAAKQLMGYLEDPEMEPTDTDDLADTLGLSPGASLLQTTQAIPENFHVNDKWPHCKSVVSKVRNQGKCGSCWAQSAAGSFDIRLCIATEGKFSGPAAWTSAGYFTSCYNVDGIDGCRAGNPGYALQKAMYGGVPTGSESKDGTCVPYFASGDALQHFHGRNKRAPKCPRSCTTGNYPRSLTQDKFFPAGHVTQTSNYEWAKMTVYQVGAAPMGFHVFKDFMSYKHGFYVKTTDQRVGGHATVMVGWQRHQGREFVLSLNSWGRKWGDNGTFKMDHTCCKIQYFIVSSIRSTQGALPLPGPNDLAGNCTDYGCEGGYVAHRPCQCVESCKRHGNCCTDYQERCEPESLRQEGSCSAFGCSSTFVHEQVCQCTPNCARYGDCCGDASKICSTGALLSLQKEEPAADDRHTAMRDQPMRWDLFSLSEADEGFADEGGGGGEDTDGSSTVLEDLKARRARLIAELGDVEQAAEH
eukprot:TRINITY_DN3716_c0_g1_i1.p1 TRINITY_DN3716_c0_g1~~TRINITY_DN3716_c0_g1_i1.p1  ORF type:complete len:706 (+),score=134.49 TRINITY_DN3716_c0_g1_i1:117-2234(+)